MNKKYEILKQKIQANLILERQEQIIVELRAMRLCLEEKIEEAVAEINMCLSEVEKRMGVFEARLDFTIKR